MSTVVEEQQKPVVARAEVEKIKLFNKLFEILSVIQKISLLTV